MYLDIVTEAKPANLSIRLVRAIATVESNCDVWAVRMEPDYKWLWNVAAGAPYRVRDEDRTRDRAPKDFSRSQYHSVNTEWICQQMSWGPMQIIGGTARWLGYLGSFPELCSVLGVRYGCLYLAWLRDRYLRHHGWHAVVAAYNAGSPQWGTDGIEFENQWYVDRVQKAGGFEDLEDETGGI